MNINDLPQLGHTEPEIYRVLKLGSFAVVPNNNAFEIHEADSSVVKQIEQKQKPPGLSQKLKPVMNYLIYPVIFIVSFLVFYTTINFPSLTAYASAFFNTKSQDQQILGQNLAAYNSWISGYFYAVSNKDLLNPNNDYDKDGLTNYDEFVLKTNPTLADSDSDGTSDGVELLNGSNPWGAGNMTKAQSKLRDQVNLINVSDRISFNVSTNKGSTSSDNSSKFDLTKPGQLTIPKLNIKVPLIFSPDPSAFDADLEKGVIHYPGTALPGQIGTMYVAGHSSDYIWKHDPMAHIFTTINHLAPGDDVYVNVYGTDGKLYTYRYRVTTQRTFSPDDQTQFIDNSVAKLNLSTCWPIGSTKERMVVSAELVNL